MRMGLLGVNGNGSFTSIWDLKDRGQRNGYLTNKVKYHLWRTNTLSLGRQESVFLIMTETV